MWSIGVYTLDLTREAVNYFSWTPTGTLNGIMTVYGVDTLHSTVQANEDYHLAVF